jgi:hypothetical protein
LYNNVYIIIILYCVQYKIYNYLLINFKYVSRQKSIYTVSKDLDWLNTVTKAKQTGDSSSIKNTKEYFNSQTYINGKGDGPHCNIDNTNECNQTYKTDATSDKFKSAFTKYNLNNDKSINELDTRFVTLRPIDETYLLNPVVSSSESNIGLEAFKTDSKPEIIDYYTPVHCQKIIPHRKLSVCYPSFGIDSLQTPDSALNASGEIKCSFSKSDMYKSECTGSSLKLSLPIESTITKDQSPNLYEYSNNSVSSNTSSSKLVESPILKNMDNSIHGATKAKEIVNLTPPKSKFLDSISNHTPTKKHEINWKPSVIKGTSHRNLESEKFSENIAAQQSRILSSSSNLMKKETQKGKRDNTTTLHSHNIGSSTLTSECTNALAIESFSSNNSISYQNFPDNLFLSNAERNDQTYTRKGKYMFLLSIY